MTTIKINGKEYPLKQNSSIASILDELGLDSKHKAIEQNGSIIANEALTDTTVADGDNIEIIQFVGGG